MAQTHAKCKTCRGTGGGFVFGSNPPQLYQCSSCRGYGMISTKFLAWEKELRDKEATIYPLALKVIKRFSRKLHRRLRMKLVSYSAADCLASAVIERIQTSILAAISTWLAVNMRAAPPVVELSEDAKKQK